MPTKKYLCIQRSPSETGCEEPSPAQMQEMFALFNDWREKFAENLADLGGALADTGRIYTPEKTIDGPLVEAKEIVGGFMIIAADSYEEAVEIVKACPAVAGPNAKVEIREIRTP